MRLATLAGVAGAGLAAPSAHACTPLPAPSAQPVPISGVKLDEGTTRRTAVRVCVDGRRVELARGVLRERDRRYSGVRIGAASAAGHRVAWIEERHRRGLRTAVVTLARVGREVRVLRRFTAQRQRTRENAEVDVLLTRRGDLAWLSGTYGGRTGVVAVMQPGKPVRRLADYPSLHLALEDGRTLRWQDGEITYAFFDLRRERCPSRRRYKPFAHNDQVILTRGLYGREYAGTTVFRACDPSTGRDPAIFQNYFEIGHESHLRFIGLDRTWAVFHQSFVERDGAGPAILTLVDVRTGRTRFAYTYNGSSRAFPPPADGAFVVTDPGVLAWISGGALYALTGTYDIVVLDRGGLAGLRAEGDALTYTRDGAPRRVVPKIS